MKFIDHEWSIVNGKTGELFHWKKYNNKILTFHSREEARDEKASLEYIIGREKAREYRVELVKVTYERVS